MKALRYLRSIVLLVLPFVGQAQQDINLDFHANFNGWKAQHGSYQSSTETTPIFNWTSGIIANPGSYDDNSGYGPGGRAFVINNNMNENDEELITHGHTLKKIPEGYTKSVRIANKSAGGECKQMRYTIQEITEENSLFTFNYAVVLMAPHRGQGFVNPTFEIKVLNEQGGLLDACTFVQRSGDPESGPNGGMPEGWVYVTVSGYGEDLMYLPWQKVALTLKDYVGQSVTMEINISDCAYSAHWGYCYFVGEVGPSQINSEACAQGDTVSVLTAPAGFDAYGWYRDPSNGTNPPEQVCVGAPLGSEEVFIVNRDLFPDNQTTQYYVCKLTANTNPGNSCTGYIGIQITNSKSYPAYECTVDCDQVGHFTNHTTSPVSEISEMEWRIREVDTEDLPTDNLLTDTVVVSSSNGKILENAENYHLAYQFPNRPQTTKYIVHLRSFSGSGETACEQIFIDTVTVHPVPDLTVPDTVRGCRGVALDVTARSILADTLCWYVGTSTEVAFRGNTYNGAFDRDTFLVVKAISNAIDCPSTETIRLQIDPFPKVAIEGDTMLCMGDRANFSVTDSSGAARFFEWTFNKPSTPPVMTHPQTNPTLSFMPTRDTIVYLLAETPNGCVDYTSVHIVMTNPLAKANLKKVCPNTEGDTRFPVKLWGERATEYSWTSVPADPSLPTGKTKDTVISYPSETTVYTMKGYGSNGCFTERTVTVEVIPFPIPTIKYSPIYIDVDDPSVNLTDVSPFGVASQWRMSDGTGSDSRSFYHTFANAEGDSVTICLTSFNELGCTDSTQIRLPIELFSVFIPNSFSPMDNSPQVQRFSVFTQNRLADFELYIYNRFGQNIFSYTTTLYDPSQPEEAASWDGKYNGDFVENGTYVYKCRYRRVGEKRLREQNGTITLMK